MLRKEGEATLQIRQTLLLVVGLHVCCTRLPSYLCLIFLKKAREMKFIRSLISLFHLAKFGAIKIRYAEICFTLFSLSPPSPKIVGNWNNVILTSPNSMLWFLSIKVSSSKMIVGCLWMMSFATLFLFIASGFYSIFIFILAGLKLPC